MAQMKRRSTNPDVHCFIVDGVSHFSILAPVTAVVANKLLHDDGPRSDIRFDEQELVQATMSSKLTP